MIEYKVEPIKDDSGIKVGNMVLACEGKEVLGSTGYRNASGEFKIYPKPAKLSDPSNAFDIHVDYERQKQGIGRNLLKNAIIKMKEDRFKTLIIPSVSENNKEFYNKVLDELKGEKIIKKHSSEPIPEKRLTTYLYIVEL
jgi:GNAT superfamily N-acetyltransferase